MTFDDISHLQRRLEGVLLDALGAEHSEVAHKAALDTVAAINSGTSARHACQETAVRVFVHLVDAMADRMHDEARRALVRKVSG